MDERIEGRCTNVKKSAAKACKYSALAPLLLGNPWLSLFQPEDLQAKVSALTT